MVSFVPPPSLRQELIDRLLIVGGNQPSKANYKEAFDELLEIMDEIDEAGAQSGLTGPEREAMNSVFEEVEKVRLMLEGWQYFFPQELESNAVWAPMRARARAVAQALTSA